jgi:transposase InsO family protein/transposase-like protein
MSAEGKETGSRSRMRAHSAEFKLSVVKRLEKGEAVYAVSKDLGLGTSIIYTWQKRYREQGLEGLQPKSSRPHHQPKKTSQWLIDKIVALKKSKPEIGGAAASEHLARFEAVNLSPNTISKVFKKHGLPDGDQAVAEAAYLVKGDDNRQTEQQLEADIGEWERFARPNPNDMWQMDIMGFYIRDAHKVYLITALDDCSRLVVNWGLFKEQTADNVLEVLRVGLAKHGAPGEVLTDQGAQFKHWNGVTQFEKLLGKLNIQHVKARSHHPQTCGKIEAFHKTIHRELIDKEFFISQEQAAEKISRFVEHYNYARPHSSLSGFTPSDKYFNVVNAVKKYLSDLQLPKNQEEEAEGKIGIGRSSRLYMIGKVLGQDIRIQELAGQLSIHVNNQLWRDISFLV